MEERLTWNEIVERYPDRWVGLSDVDWKNEANIKSAIVKYPDKSSSELLRIKFSSEPNLEVQYTTPDNLGQMGFVG